MTLRSVKTGRLLVLEDAAEAGCVGKTIAAHVTEAGISLKSLKLINLGSRFIPHGSVGELRKMCGLDAASVAGAVREMFSEPAEPSCPTDGALPLRIPEEPDYLGLFASDDTAVSVTSDLRHDEDPV